MMYGIADFLYLLFYGWLIVLVLHLVFGGILSLLYRDKQKISATFKDTP